MFCDVIGRSTSSMLSQGRKIKAKVFRLICIFASYLSVLLLLFLVFSLLRSGVSRLSFSFFSNFASRFPDQAGIKAALFGSLWLMSLTLFFAVPLGVGAAIYLEEFSRKNFLSRIVQLNISNLAGIPSIVYGMLGLVVFVRIFGFGRSVLSGALTMSLLVLPVIIIASQEAIRSVPNSIRYAALALGATRWQVVRDHVLPISFPAILTGIILALSRALGETAPLLLIGALSFVAFVPESLQDPFTALPIQIFNWASRPQESFHELAAAGILVLLAVLLSMNAVAIFLRAKYQGKK